MLYEIGRRKFMAGKAEAFVGVLMLNKMTDLGMPNSYPT